MRSRGILATAAALTLAASLAPAASAAGGATATQRGTTTESRITTIRGVCNGTGRFALSVRDIPDIGQTDVAVSGLPEGHQWSEEDSTTNSDHTGGVGGGVSGWTPTNGRYDTYTTYEHLADPVARANVHSEDRSVVCNAHLFPSEQSGRMTCTLPSRSISIIATRHRAKIDLLARLRTVRANSPWKVTASLSSQDGRQGAGGMVRASRAGLAQFRTSFAWAKDRTITVAFLDRHDHGCRATLSAGPLPPG
jgi:hypothetical protein